MKSSFLFFVIVLALSVLFQGCSSSEEEEPLPPPPPPLPTLKIGVMLPYSGEYASDWDNSLDWAVENINHAGGVSGCNIELVKKDIAVENIAEVADGFISDATITSVIGPFTSTQTFEVAPKFIEGNKVLIAPVASAANRSRAFSGSN